jgi:hypothetical protein
MTRFYMIAVAVIVAGGTGQLLTLVITPPWVAFGAAVLSGIVIGNAVGKTFYHHQRQKKEQPHD